MRVDLHMHSNNSDGSESVESIVDRAVSKGLKAIALTDHDNVHGLMRASEYAKGKIAFINGIEISSYHEREIHILGYGFDYDNDIMLSRTEELVNQRKTRIKKILAKLRELGMNIDDDEIDYSCAGRVQVANLMVKKRYATSKNDAFNRFLGAGCSAYIPSMRLSPEEAVTIIRESGGQPVIAHPMHYLEDGILEDMIDVLRPLGLVGLECHYPTHSEDVTYRLSKIAHDKGLIETVGCDFHGTNGQNDIGQVKWEMSRENVERIAGHSLDIIE